MSAETYDYVIVGAGSAGCALANRLSANPDTRVLLLEAGGWDWNPLIAVPMGARHMFSYGLYQWGDVSEPDPELGGRLNDVPHGRVVGGTSSLNYMAHVRGHPLDYARWVADGASGWSYPEVLPFFRECETWEHGADAWRGGDGELGAREGRSADPIFEAWFDAARSIGLGQTPDYNGAQPEGFGPIQFSIRNGRRSSSSFAFLRPALKRSNLTVRTEAFVTRVLFDGARASGIEYERRGKKITVRAGVRTVLCLGAINTPHLLMLSGVGPAEHLRAHGIEPVSDLPVGKNLEDHLGSLLVWKRQSAGEAHRSLRLDRITMHIARAYLFGTGPAATLGGGIFGFLRSAPQLEQPDLQFVIPMMAPNADVWLPWVKKSYPDRFSIRIQLVGQRSRGEVLLRSADPKDRPKIVYNSLSDPYDVAAMRSAVRIASAMVGSAPLARFKSDPVTPEIELRSDEEIDAFVRESAFQQYHPASTCPMGTGEKAVLNPDLSVRGVQGLYVVDASAMPYLVSGNPNVVIMMMAARAAALWTNRAAPE